MNEIRVYPISRDETEKAGYLLLPEAVLALKHDLPVTAFVAVEGGRAVGALAGAIDGEVFEICSLYVEPGHRRRGAGRALIQKLCELIPEDEMAIRAQFTLVDEEGEVLQSFLKAMGFRKAPSVFPRYYVGDLEDIQIGGENSKGKEDTPVFSFSEISEKLLKRANHRSIREGAPLPDGGLTGEDADRNLSFCVIKEGKIKAYVTAADRWEGLVEITSLWSLLEDPREAFFMLSRFVDNLREKYVPATRVAVLASGTLGERMLDRFFTYSEPCSCRMERL
ncbi:MAG: GNAT family N-acetyltransferase [Lachnospiraceae bacterium]|nr:GNAT family N-acetyltransferase [Lachnospiraceae bacterium]